MAYGGAGAGPPPTAGGPSSIRQVKLDKECELRIEVSAETPLRLRLLNGTAEVFGTEIAPEIWLTFPPRLKFAVFTWYGATIEMDGTTETDYTADETPMISYVNVHAILEARRNRAKESPSDSDSSQVIDRWEVQKLACRVGSQWEMMWEIDAGIQPKKLLQAGAYLTRGLGRQGWKELEISPERSMCHLLVIVVGPTDSGKSTLSRMLLSWAAKQAWKPTFVDLDIGQGSITIPGCIAATPIEMPIDPVEGIPLEMPLVFFYGHTTPSIQVLVVFQNCCFTVPMQTCMVINTMGWIEGLGYELLLHAIDTFNANVILVLGQEKLCSMLKDVLKRKPNVDVVKLQKSGGVVSRNAKVRQKARSYRIREYFYGLANDLSPHSNIANFSDLSVYRIGGGPQAPRSALPIGAEPAADPTRLVHNVAGFIYITDIDIQRKKITYLAPSAGVLPSRSLIMGTLTWLET
ncbi:unnamed protein product [Thlaspi arvense]|uniref:Protein CLP1 homolog n=1 Tax=Thlaspi arvense TaxID=13288 RepID=A0AAU9RSC6_THLAR|nr:unnamed protein product [Thlaspi arvense]